jgi:hypothetical protein
MINDVPSSTYISQNLLIFFVRKQTTDSNQLDLREGAHSQYIAKEEKTKKSQKK